MGHPSGGEPSTLAGQKRHGLPLEPESTGPVGQRAGESGLHQQHAAESPSSQPQSQQVLDCAHEYAAQLGKHRLVT